MFTGIIDHRATIISVDVKAQGMLFGFRTDWNQFKMGESICVDGVCLTVCGFRDNEFSAELSPETLRVSKAGEYRKGTRVNLERSLLLGDPLGGHWVTGHVDCIGRISGLKSHGDFVELNVSGVAPSFAVKKGSIALDGVSLTINDVYRDEIGVMLIPHTWELTNMSDLRINSPVNIEYDYLAKLVVNQMNILKGPQ